MKVGISFGGQEWERGAAFVQEAEKLGVDSVWTAETWGFDAATPIGYLAADPVAFYTNGPEGELTREASPKELEDFMKLLPKGVQPVQPCMRTVAA